jgi:hypothetical protein
MTSTRATRIRFPLCALFAALLLAVPLSAMAGWSGGDDGSHRSGFTLELTLGVGYQIYSPDKGDSRKKVGLSGLNLGIGGFLNKDMAVLFRISGTNVTHDVSGLDMTTISAVGGPAVQYWFSNNVKVEAGAGFAVVRAEASAGGVTISGDDEGWGGILALGYDLWHNDNHSLQVGLEYAPAWYDELLIHNVGLTFGWQLL